MKTAWGPAVAALLVRVAAIALSDRVVADVLRYQKVATHLLDVSWNPYLAARLYPYPPVWMAFEAGAEAIARASGLSFAALVKLPVLAAEVAIVIALARLAGRSRAAGGAAWLYALHPVAILVSAAHGQFDSLPLLAVLLAVIAFDRGRTDAAALALAAGIALKSFPALLLPVFLLRLDTPRERVRFAVLAGAPVALLLAPFLLADAAAVARELFAYGGVADFGWIGVWRGLRWLAGDGLGRGEARHWGTLVALAKVLFFAGYAVAVVRTRRASLAVAALAILVAFQALYGALSAQYLLWVVPLAVAAAARPWAIAHAIAATIGLVGFYLFLAPGVLAPEGMDPLSRGAAGTLWVAGATGCVLVAAAWLAALLRSPGPPDASEPAAALAA
jgi:uncharacterized membrane protein